MAWARWGASKWVQNEPRAVADNTYEEAIPVPPDYLLEINFTDFYDLIKKGLRRPGYPHPYGCHFETRRLPGELEDSSVLPPSGHQ